MIEGALNKMSLMKRTAVASFEFAPYSARYVPARMPIGAPIAKPIPVMIMLPTIELSRPPTTPGGAVFFVKTSSDNPPTPFHSSVPRMMASMVRPRAVAA